MCAVDSKTLVRQTIEFQGPHRIPFAFWSLLIDRNTDLSDTPLLNRFHDSRKGKVVCDLDDIKLLDYQAATSRPAKHHAHDGTEVDEWGVKWTNRTVVQHPLPTWDKWEHYPFPDPLAAERFADVDELIKANRNKYLLGLVWNTTFERMWMLRGMENLLQDPYIYPKPFFELRDKYLEFNLAILNRWLRTEVDAIYFGDDLGTQNGLIMSPEMWRKLYLPMYRELFSKARAAGKHVFFHSCGNITDIIADLIDCGLNVLNPIQPRAMDAGFVLKEFGKDLVLWGATDMQETITFGTPTAIEAEIARTVQLCHRQGGYIGGTAQGSPPGTPNANLEAFMRAFLDVAGIEI